jgi:uncharacterized protein YabE (DUF348 family)
VRRCKKLLAGYDRIRALLSALGVLCPPRKVLAIGVIGGLIALLGSVYWATQHAVVLEINGLRFVHRTHARSPWQVLREARISLRPEDRLYLPDEEGMRRGTPIRMDIARVGLIVYDGSATRVRTHAPDLAGLIRDSGVIIFPHDRLYMMGAEVSPEARLPNPEPPQRLEVAAWLAAIRRPIHITVRRAVPLKVQDGAVTTTFYTTARTVGEALYERGLVIYLGDRVSPSLEAELAPGQSVFIERSKPVVLSADGLRRALRTRAERVAELLSEEGITLGPKDYALPDPRSAISRDLRVSVVRVHDEYYTQEVSIPFNTRWEPDPSLEIDQKRVAREGREGARRQRIRIHYENGRELYRTEEEEWVAREPLDRIIHYGTKIVLRTVETPSGPLTYWRKVRMLATSYSASTAGVSPSSPWYGRTRLGWQAGKGIVAVDPRVVNLGQAVYVPGYGVGVAADTGGAIKGRRIDLCYDEDNLKFWYRWVDVYLLTPVPPSEKIIWRMPE